MSRMGAFDVPCAGQKPFAGQSWRAHSTVQPNRSTPTVQPNRSTPLRGPASWTTDASVSRNFKVGEKTTFQFRADMFNATNRVNYSGPTTNLNAATFGQISGTGAMRVIQLNAKLRF
jgi:hypothetical protein